MAINYDKITPMKLVFDNVTESMKKRNGEPEFPTGINALDEIIWGLHKGELTVIGGRPGECKTTLALNIAWNLCDMRKKVLFLSLEMSREQLTERLFSKMTGATSFKLRRGLYEEKELQEKIDLFTDMVKDSTMLVTDGMGFVFDEVEELISSLDPQFEVLFIDHLQMISCKGHFKKLDAMEEYVRKLKELAEKYNIAIVALSQVNRSVSDHKNRRPKLENLKSCVVGDTLIGNKKIKDIFNNQDYSDVKSFNLKTKKVEFIKPAKIINTGKLQCYKIKTKSGKNIIVSEDTKLFTGKWKKAKELKVNEKILLDNE